MNKIEIDLSKLDKHVRTFVRSEIKIANAYDIPVKLLSKRHVWMDGVRVNGYFCDATPEMVVACYKKPIDWLEIFVHESCHRDQCIENTRIWTKTIDGHDALTMLWQWLDKTIELTPDKLHQVIQASMMVELDCERRSVKKIKRYKLPIDIEAYTKKANAYVYFFLSMQETRKWYGKGKSPIYLDEVWKQMPAHFDNDYMDIPPKYRMLMLEHCYDR